LHLINDEEIQEDTHYKTIPDAMFESLYKLYGGTDIRRLSIQLESQSERHDEILQNEESIEQSDFVHIQNRQDLDVDDASVLSTVRNSDISDESK